MSPEEFFAHFQEVRAVSPKLKLVELLSDPEQCPPEILEGWEKISSSGDASAPVADDEFLIRGITEPHFDPNTRDIGIHALGDAASIGLSVKRMLPGEPPDRAYRRCLADEEARMAIRRERKPEPLSRYQVTGLSKLAVDAVRTLRSPFPTADSPTQRAYYVFNSHANGNPSHADICAALPDKGTSKFALHRARAELLRLLVAGYIPKEDIVP